MLTNLIFSVVVTIVTNTAEVNNERYNWIAGPCPEGREGCAVFHGIRGALLSAATERTVTTTYTAKTNWVCKEPFYEIPKGECVLSNKVEVLKLEQKWVSASSTVNTNREALNLSGSFWVATNGNVFAGLTNWIVTNTAGLTIITKTNAPDIVIRSK